MSERRIAATLASEITPRRRWNPAGWGPWHLDRKTAELWAEGADWSYYVDLETCTSSAQVLDWICQVAGKTWADDATVAGLARAFHEVLDPQATLCSCGQDKRLTRAEIRDRAASIGRTAT